MLIDFSELDITRKQRLLHSAVVPRPIGLISTIDREEHANLAPFSFFNVVSIDPPMLVFSPLRRVRDNTTKHTIENIREIPEAVVHVVGYPMLYQMNLTACEYPETVDEFRKAGFTKEKARQVRPWMIQECPVKFECRIKEMRPLGKKGGAGTVCYAEVLCMHVESGMVDGRSQIDPLQLQPVARLGGDDYMRLTRGGLFTMPKPNRQLGMGFDGLPAHVLTSEVLTANELGQLAMVERIPAVEEGFEHSAMQYLLLHPVNEERLKEIHRIAKKMLGLGLVSEAWQVLLRADWLANPTEEAVSTNGEAEQHG